MDLTALDVSHPVMESVYHQYYDEPRYRPSVITAQRLAAECWVARRGRLLPVRGRGGAGAGLNPQSPWSTKCHRCGCPTGGTPRRAAAAAQGPGRQHRNRARSPSPLALTLVAPLGFDVTTVAVVERLDPARTVGIDMLIDDARHPAPRAGHQPGHARRHARRGPRAVRPRRQAVSVIRDSGGFVTQRVVATIVNIAADMCQQAHLLARPTWRPP
jgi:3-hydroxybutyryl-CoA dehydrogenase